VELLSLTATMSLATLLYISSFAKVRTILGEVNHLRALHGEYFISKELFIIKEGSAESQSLSIPVYFGAYFKVVLINIELIV
jgi:hypothetical protein